MGHESGINKTEMVFIMKLFLPVHMEKAAMENYILKRLERKV
jgi:hypothetical protein